MRQRFALISYTLAGVFIAFLPCQLFAQRIAHNPDSFACRSNHYMLEDFERQPSVPSPDRAKAVRLTKKFTFRITVGNRAISEFALNDVSCNIEIAWSPDSSQFFISYSTGGSIGRYHVRLYRIVESTVRETRVPAAVAARFKTKHWCEARGNNLFFLDWTPDSKVAFFVAEVYPTGDCGPDLGAYRGYAVRLQDGRILRVFGEKQTDSIEKNCRMSGRLVLPSQ
jgi:hypothetical protein